MSKKIIGDENSYDKKAARMKFQNTQDNKWSNIGSRTAVRPEKVTIVDTATGKKYGTRTIQQKVTEGMSSLRNFLSLYEGTEDFALPEILMKEIQKNIRDGAKDTTQRWKGALELVNTAYHVANIKLPNPQHKQAWKQYEENISYGVKQLADVYGRDTKKSEYNWRVTDPLSEDAYSLEPSLTSSLTDDQRNEAPQKRRIFAEIDGAGQVEIHAKNFDEFIEKFENQLRSKGARLRVDARDAKSASLSVMVKGNDSKWYVRERIKIREYS